MLSQTDLAPVVDLCGGPGSEKPEHVPGVFRPAPTDPVEYVREAVRRLEVGPPKVRAPGVSYGTLASAFRTSLDFDGEIRHELRDDGVTALLDAGATVIVNRFNRAEPRLSAMVRQIREMRLADVCANAYLSRSGSTSFGWHFDDHDVVAMQLSGSKRWEFAGRATVEPLQGDVGQRAAKPEGPDFSIQLHPGDIMRVPRGTWHQAITDGSAPSLHLSVSLFPLTLLHVVSVAAERIMLGDEGARVDLAALDSNAQRIALQRTIGRIGDLLQFDPLIPKDAEHDYIDSATFDEPM